MKKRPGGTTHLSISLPTAEANVLTRRAKRVYGETVKLAGVALGKIRGATTVDAIVAAFAVQRTGIV